MLLLLSVLLPPRGTSQALPLGGDTQGRKDGHSRTASGTGRRTSPGGVPALPCPAGEGLGAELQGDAAVSGVGRGLCWQLHGDWTPWGSPRAWGLPGGSEVGVKAGGCLPCAPAASLSLPRILSLRPPRGDRDGGSGPLLVRQRPGRGRGVGVALGVVIPWLEVCSALGGFAQGGQAALRGLWGT